MNIVLIGGSAHSTPALWFSLAGEAGLQNLRVVLTGRDRSRLNAVERACGLLGIGEGNRIECQVVDAVTGWEALEHADVIVIQVRNGGYAGRCFDETFPLRYGVCGDEGLGPGGLSAGIRNWKAIGSALKQISRFAPEALVLMLSSPVGLLVRAGKRMFPGMKIAGICELPWTTLMDKCRTAGLDPAEVGFDYFGVNHLGWIYRLTKDGRDVTGAVPMKYLRLHYEREKVIEEQRNAQRPRGRELDELGRTAFHAYCQGTRRDVVAALEARPSPWYRHAVAPLIAGLAGRDVKVPFFLSVPNDGFDPGYRDDDVLEYAHAVVGGKLRRLPRVHPVPVEMLELTTRFVRYEQAGTRAVLTGCAGDVECALRAHPWVREDAVREIAREITGKTAFAADQPVRVVSASSQPLSDGAGRMVSPEPRPARALIMAGGRSERMRATTGALHKALVPVQGVPLLERNLRALLSQGFQEIVIAISAAEPAIGEYVDGPGSVLAGECGAHLQILWEANPLGTIGAVREAIGDADELLVVNVDNLTSLPLEAFVAFHRQSAAALTIAAHQEPFQIPFGELELSGDAVRQYLEKPVKPIWISSGTYVAGRQSCEFLPKGRRTDVPDLVAALLAAGRHVAAFRHKAMWIDVNHAEAVRKAEELVSLYG